GVQFGADTDTDDPGPGAGWDLQRRIPHAGIASLEEATTEGDTGPQEPGDTDRRAKLWFWRDDRGTEALTLHFDIVADDALTADDYTSIMKIPDGNGGFTEIPINLASGSLTTP